MNIDRYLGACTLAAVALMAYPASAERQIETDVVEWEFTDHDYSR